MRIVVLIFFVLSSFAALKAQNNEGIIRGNVSHLGSPLEFALVVIEGTGFGVTTDALGNFKLKHLPVGDYILVTSLIGYKTSKISVVITANSERNINIALEADETLHEDEIVVSGTLKESYISASPIKVEVFNASFFKKNPTSNIFESLQMVNGVQPQLNCNVCNTGDIHINGMEGAYTMVTIDGMPIVSALSTVYGLSGIPNSLIKRVEIVKGPASTLYGSEAVGGLINIITKDPASAAKTAIDLYATSQQEYNLDLSTKARMGKAHILTGVNYFNFNNKMDVNKDNFTDVTLQHRISIFNKWNFDRKLGRLASVAARYYYEDRWGGEMNWNRSFRGGDEVYGESIFTKRLELIGVYQLPFKEMLKIQYSLNSHHQNSVYGTMFYKAQQYIGFGQLIWEKKWSTRNSLVAGLPIRFTFYDDNTPGTASSDSNINRPQRIFLPGIFLQNEFIATDKINFLTGIRYDFNTEHGSIWSPRLGLKYELNKRNYFRISGGNGYRVVNLFTEDHAALTGARQVVIKENLRPEQSWNANINYQGFINHKHGFIGLDLSLFYTYFTNKIIGDFLTDPNKIIYQNINEYAISKGITTNLDFNFNNGFKAVFGATLMDVYAMENSEKIPQIHAPKISGTYSISYQLPKGRWNFDLTGRITGPMNLPVFENDFRPTKSPTFGLHNIQISKRLKNGLEFYGAVKNIFNFIPRYTFLHPDDPFDRVGGKYFLADGSPNPSTNPNGYTFDAAYNYAPIQGIRFLLGIRYTIN